MLGTSPFQTTVLRGRRILVVEDEYMIAEEVASDLVKAGAHILGPVPSIVEAMRLIETTDRIDIALLDVNLGSQPVWPIVDALQARHVPLVLATGYDAHAVPRAYGHVPRCEKPANGRELVQALARALTPVDPE